MAVGGPRTGKLPWKGSAFLTAEGSSKSSLAISSPAWKQAALVLERQHSRTQNAERRMRLSKLAYLHRLAFGHLELDLSGSRREKGHAHLHDLDFRIRCVGINVAAIRDEIPE